MGKHMKFLNNRGLYVLICLLVTIVSSFNANETAESDHKYNLYAVYFGYIPRIGQNFEKKFEQHMQDFVDSGLSNVVKKFHVVLATDAIKSQNEVASQLAKMNLAINTVTRICPDAIISSYFRNEFEYQGILKVWKQALKIPEKSASKSLILYFHSKGMTSSGKEDLSKRVLNDKIMFKYVIMQWKKATQHFDDQRVNKAGLAAGQDGQLFGNFWWIRASYAKKLVVPIIQKNRFWYEDWISLLAVQYNPSDFNILGRVHDFSINDVGLPYRKSMAGDCISLCPPNLKLGKFFAREGTYIPCWDKETLLSGEIIKDASQIKYN